MGAQRESPPPFPQRASGPLALPNVISAASAAIDRSGAATNANLGCTMILATSRSFLPNAPSAVPAVPRQLTVQAMAGLPLSHPRAFSGDDRGSSYIASPRDGRQEGSRSRRRRQGCNEQRCCDRRNSVIAGGPSAGFCKCRVSVPALIRCAHYALSLRKEKALVAQRDRATDFESVGCRFEPCRARHEGGARNHQVRSEM